MSSTAPRSSRYAITRAIAAVLVWIVVGAVVSVMVAWGLALRVSRDGWNRVDFVHVSDRLRVISIYGTGGASQVEWRSSLMNRFPTIDNMTPPGLGRRGRREFAEPSAEVPIPAWGRLAGVLENPDAFPVHGADRSTGWPLRCLWHSWFTGDARMDGLVVNDSGLAAGRYTAADARSLPLMPVWSGFALNTLFYGAIARGLWRFTIVVRGHRRRGRGQCVGCAYDRRGLAPGTACPECGDVPRSAPSVPSV